MVGVWLLGSDIITWYVWVEIWRLDEQFILKPHSGCRQVDAGVLEGPNWQGCAWLMSLEWLSAGPELARRCRSLHRARFSFPNGTQTVLIIFMKTDSKFQPSWWAFPMAADLKTNTSSVPWWATAADVIFPSSCEIIWRLHHLSKWSQYIISKIFWEGVHRQILWVRLSNFKTGHLMQRSAYLCSLKWSAPQLEHKQFSHVRTHTHTHTHTRKAPNG